MNKFGKQTNNGMLPNLIHGRRDKPIYIINKWNCRRLRGNDYEQKEQKKSWNEQIYCFIYIFFRLLAWSITAVESIGDECE